MSPVTYKSFVFVIIGRVYVRSSRKLTKKNDLKDVSRMDYIFGVERIQRFFGIET